MSRETVGRTIREVAGQNHFVDLETPLYNNSLVGPSSKPLQRNYNPSYMEE